jgi:hypothetical protein
VKWARYIGKERRDKPREEKPGREKRKAAWEADFL